MIRTLLTRLKNDDRGAAIIELAIIAPVLASMTIGIIDLSNGFSRKLALEQAAQRSIEKVMQTTGEETVDDTIKNEAASAAGVGTDHVTVTYSLTCDGVAQASFLTECSNNNTEVRYIEVSVWDTYTPMIPVHFAGMTNGSYRLTATQGIRTQ